METTCPLVGEGTDELPVLTSAYCNPVGEVVNWRFGAGFSGAALAASVGNVNVVVSARSGEWRRMDRRDVDDAESSSASTRMSDVSEDDNRLGRVGCAAPRAICHEKQVGTSRKRDVRRVAMEGAIIVKLSCARLGQS